MPPKIPHDMAQSAAHNARKLAHPARATFAPPTFSLPTFSPPKFALLGECGANNPASIAESTLLQWQQDGAIRYLGSAADVRPFIASSFCITLPSFYKEGVPRVLLEAMSMGKPIITTNVSGCRECVAKPYEEIFYDGQCLLLGRNGILIPPQNPHALKAAMRYLCTHESLAYTLGAEGRKIAKKHFAMPLIMRIYSAAARLWISSSLDRALDAPHTSSTSTPPSTRHQTKSSSLRDTNSNTPANTPRDTRPIIACISNTAFGMYNFRLQPLLELQRQGFSIHIIAPFDSSTPKLKAHGFICHHFAIDSKSLNPLKDFHTCKQLLTLLRQIRPALLFSYTIKPAIYGSFIARILRIPTISVITGLGYVFIGGGVKKRLLRALVCAMYRVALKRVKEVWFLNPDDRAEFLVHRLIATSQARLLPSEGVDTEHFSPPKGAHEAGDTDKAEGAHEAENCFTFLLIARMLWDKGVGEFVQAASMLQREWQQSPASNGGGAAHTLARLRVRFVLLGSINAQNPSAIPESTMRSWQEAGIIEYMGEQSDVRGFIESSSCVVLPSYREGAPMALLEALSMGKPIITTNVSGCKEIIASAKDMKGAAEGMSEIGLLCESRSAPALADAMRRMLSLPAHRREQMGQNARAFIQSHHDRDKIATLYASTAARYAKCQKTQSAITPSSARAYE